MQESRNLKKNFLLCVVFGAFHIEGNFHFPIFQHLIYFLFKTVNQFNLNNCFQGHTQLAIFNLKKFYSCLSTNGKIFCHHNNFGFHLFEHKIREVYQWHRDFLLFRLSCKIIFFMSNKIGKDRREAQSFQIQSVLLLI